MKTIFLLGYDGVEALDLVGPLETFAQAMIWPNNINGYKVLLVGLTDQEFTAESGLTMRPALSLGAVAGGDTLVLPGGVGLRDPRTSNVLSEWLRRNAGSFRRVTSVCTGIYGLAEAGLLDGRRVTTHWRYASDVAARFPRLKVEADAIFIKDGKYYTSAGVLAGVDLALALIDEDYGPSSAMDVARNLVVYFRRPGNQAQFSEPLKFQTRAPDRFADLIAWMTGNITRDLSLRVLASRVGLSPRQFGRRFKDAFGMTPGRYVERLRLDEARALLAQDCTTIDRVAATVGFNSEDSFRRAFERCFCVSPGAFRSRMSAHRSPRQRAGACSS